MNLVQVVAVVAIPTASTWARSERPQNRRTSRLRRLL